MFFLEIQVKIPKTYKAVNGQIKIRFQFATPELRPFGQRMTAFINVVNDSVDGSSVLDFLDTSDLINFNKNDRHRFCQTLQEIPSTKPMPLADTSESDDELRLLQMASELADEGYGHFDVCLKALKRCKADLSATKSQSKAQILRAISSQQGLPLNHRLK